MGLPEQAPLGATGGDWTGHAMTVLAGRGIRAGPARVAVIEALGRSGGCVTADQVASELAATGRHVGTASVYRALHLLAREALVQAAAVPGGPVRYELVHPDGAHHHHLLCTGCGRTERFTDEGLERALAAVADQMPFPVVAHEVTLHGTCTHCSHD